MKRITFAVVFLLGAAALSAGCGQPGPLDAQPGVSSEAQALAEDPMVLNAFASLRRVAPNQYTLNVAGHPVQLNQAGNTFKVVSEGQTLFEVTSAAIAKDLLLFQENTPPETSASLFKWLGKLIKAIGKFFGGLGDPTGANSCGATARLTCGEGCVQSLSSTVISCRFTCKNGDGCGGLL